MSYQPRTGSVADRAHQMLTARGELSAAALADAIDHDDPGSLMACLAIAINHGYIAKTKRNGLAWYSVGDGVPLKKDDEPDDDPVVQRVVAAGSRPKAEPVKAVAPVKPAAMAAFSMRTKIVQTPVPAAADGVRFTVERETRLIIEQGDTRMVLGKADVARLREVIESQVG